MGWFNRIFGGGGGAITNPETGPQVSGPTTNMTESGLVLNDERAMALSAVWSCVRLISETVGSLPVGVYERTPDGREQTDKHFLYRLFKEAPNDLMDPLAFREAMTLQLVLWGNAYAKIERDGKGVPISLMPLRADRMTPTKEAGTVTYHYQKSAGEHIFAKENIFHIKGMSVDGIVGMSPLGYSRHIMGVTASADMYASKSFSTGGVPRGVLTVDRILTADQREALRRIYEGINVRESSGTWVLEGGTQWVPTQIPPDDMQMLQSRQFQLAEVARIFRVPSFMINDAEKSTTWGSGIEQQNIGFLQYTIRPYLTRWESTVSHSLLSRTDRRNYFIAHNVEGLLRADSAGRSAFYSQAAQNGWLTRNEIRSLENLPPHEGGDELTVQVNLTPVNDLPGLADGNQTITN